MQGHAVTLAASSAALTEMESETAPTLVATVPEQNILDVGVSVTAVAFGPVPNQLYAVGGFPGAHAPVVGWNLSLTYVDLSILLKSFIKQEITFTGEAWVRLEFSDGLPAMDVQLPVDLGGLNLPTPWDGDLTITPHYYLKGTLHNRTDIRLTPTIEWKSCEFKGAARAVGISLGSFNTCDGCQSFPLFSIPVNVLDTDIPVTSPEIAGAPITITGSTDSRPRIVAASRESIPMFIYDQVAVDNPLYFGALLGESQRMLLYGERFFAPGLTATICMHGAEDAIPVTWINNNVALIEVPNRFRLLPGTARIQLTNTNGVSNALDLQVVMPRPNLATVGPNLWAADMSLDNIPISLIDGYSPAGFDTFITRPDYYVRMAQLWDQYYGASSQPCVSPSGGTPSFNSLCETFPAFDFSQRPPLPQIFVNDRAIGFFRQPQYNGILFGRLARADYERPGLFEVRLGNPGPGGGFSQPRILTVAAPPPMATAVTPATALPGSGDLQVTITGPDSVPYWSGFQTPIFSNFNADSVAMWNGIPLETQYIAANRLSATIPAALLTLGGTHHITVHTPANGTTYFDEISGNDIVSGGTSFPLPFTVAWPTPVITAIAPDISQLGYLTSDDLPPFNLSVSGEGFQPHSQVLVNGEPRTTLFVDENALEVQLLDSDVDTPGPVLISVVTSGPGGGHASPAILTITTDPVTP